jgi:hypothetical protein
MTLIHAEITWHPEIAPVPSGDPPFAPDLSQVRGRHSLYHSPFSGSHMQVHDIPCEQAKVGGAVTGVRCGARVTPASQARVR